MIQLASKHEDAIERLIAFRALMMKDPHEAANLTISEVDDITLVGTSDGICGMEEYVSDIRLNMMQYNRERRKISNYQRSLNTRIVSDNCINKISGR